MKIIDSHIHFWDVQNGYNSWLSDTDLPLNVDPITLKGDVKNFVHIEAHTENLSPLCEYNWLQKFGNYNIRVVVFIDFNQDLYSFERQVIEIARYDNIVGVRQIMATSSISQYSPYQREIPNDLYSKLTMLSKYNLIFECQMYPNQILDCISDIIESGVVMVIEHFGLPIYTNKPNILQWYQVLEQVELNDNFYLKLSGLDLNNQDDDFDYLIEKVISDVSSDKLCYGSNFPVSNMNDYICWMKRLSDILSEEKDFENIFFKTANKLYKFNF